MPKNGNKPDGHNETIIRSVGVTKTYRTGKVTVEALRGVDLEVQRGEMVAVMGPSGSGKTTLLNTLSGLDEIDSGIIEIDGRDLAQMSDRERTRYRAENMGFVFQFYNLLPVLSAVENVEMPLLLNGQRVNAKDARRRALKALEAVGLAGQAQQLPGELSGGQRQRVTIARALVNNPAIVWADEPTGDLDSRTAQEILDLMRQLNRENKQTFVIVTHDPEIGAQADRIITIRDGLCEDCATERLVPLTEAVPGLNPDAELVARDIVSRN
ncbi:MAG: ABC transporter ATP-binding protein [Anaerolineae bacterium]|nr:ABC transporter ATP-binding protein [Anaerolineae bacterium]